MVCRKCDMRIIVRMAILVLSGSIALSCNMFKDKVEPVAPQFQDSTGSVRGDTVQVPMDTLVRQHSDSVLLSLDLRKDTVHALVDFAETLIGTPYRYGSTNPQVGFDCSGFITYVFNHFNIKVPRSSRDFDPVGRKVSVPEAKRGDIILFTGTDSTEREIGHMGIVTQNIGDSLKFIHSTSGKLYGVTITDFNGYYKKRFVKVIRVFKANDV